MENLQKYLRSVHDAFLLCWVFALKIFWGLGLGFFSLRNLTEDFKKIDKNIYLRAALKTTPSLELNFFSPFPGCFIYFNVA